MTLGTQSLFSTGKKDTTATEKMKNGSKDLVQETVTQVALPQAGSSLCGRWMTISWLRLTVQGRGIWTGL